MSSTLALADHLRSLDDQSLIAVLRRRGVSATGIRDFFDLADQLLSPESIWRALAGVDRATLAAFAGVAVPDAASREFARALLLGAAGGSEGGADAAPDNVPAQIVWDEVREQLRNRSALGLPDAEALVTTPAPEPDPLTDAELEERDALAAERAFTAVASVAELLHHIEREPPRLLTKGGLAAADTLRLAAVIASQGDDAAGLVDDLIDTAESAGLLTRMDGRVEVTASASDWAEDPTARRWIRLADGFAANLPTGIRSLLAEFRDRGERLHALIHWQYPAGGDALTRRVESGMRVAELLGVAADGTPSTAGRHLLAGDRAKAEGALESLLPASVDRVYLQHDLTIVALGPLEPSLDRRLRVIADAEGRALASTYRITPASLTRGITAGHSAASIIEFLESISLTGIPQPLRYVIDETAERYGLLRVGSLGGTGSYVRSVDTDLLRTVFVDQELVALGLTVSGPHRLLSRRDRSQLYWGLANARYPVVVEDENEQLVSQQRSSAASAPVAVPDDPLLALVESLRRADAELPSDTAQAWLARTIETAIRNRDTLDVSVRMPDGSLARFELEPTSLAAGRLRARDHASGLERTLPLASVASVERVEPQTSR